MAWIGLSPGALCEMIKDRQRNGGRDFAALITGCRRAVSERRDDSLLHDVLR
jgi:hypothetical protein